MRTAETRKTYTQNDFRKVYLCAMITGIIIALVYIFFSRGEAWRVCFFSGNDNTFFDFFAASFWHTRRREPYSYVYNVYPAFAYFILYIFAIFMPASNIKESVLVTRYEQISIYFFILFIIFSYLMLNWVISNSIKCKEREKIILMVSIFFSSASIYTIERGNLIILALSLLIFYIFNYNSDSKYLKEAALLALAMAAGFKPYLAIFGILIPIEKKWNDAIRCIVYGITVFILPFLWFKGGLSSISLMLHNAAYISYDVYNTELVNTRIDLSNTLYAIYSVFNKIDINIWKITGAVMTACFALLLLASCMTNTKWKSVLALSLAFSACQQVCWTYNLLILVVPILVLLFDKSVESLKGYDWIYLICFIALMLPWPYGGLNPFPFIKSVRPFTLPIFVQGLTLLLMVPVLLVDIYVNAFLNYKKRGFKLSE